MSTARKRSTSNGSFVEDVDVQPAAGVQVVQLTPAGSACSIGMGTGLPAYDEVARYPARSRACTWWWRTSSRRALSWPAAALRSAPSRMWAEESSTHGWPTPMATV
jgi:hypothetical protein